MPTWYRTGSIAVTNGSTTVTGTGTAWVAVVNVGDALHAPDGRSYEVAAINSNTSLTLASGYLGVTASGQDYAIQPTRGVTIAFNDNAQALLSLVQGYVDGVLSGRFPAGTAGAPSVAGAADPDTGMSFPGGNQLRFSTGGAQRALLSSAALTLDVPLTGSAVQSSQTDATPGRVQLFGAFGLGKNSGVTSLSSGDDLPFRTALGTHLIPDGNTDVAGLNWPHFFSLARGDDVQAVLAFDTISNTEPEAAIRLHRIAGNGSPWRRLLHTGNLVGGIGLSGGVPNEGTRIFERGSNANGSFIKFRDGTMICWKAITDSGVTFTATGNIYRSESFVPGSWPATFSGGDLSVFSDFRGLNNSQIWGATAGTNFPGDSYRYFKPDAGTNDCRAYIMGIGRWYG